MVQLVESAFQIETELPEKQAFGIETDDDFIKLHTLMILNGKRGGGKTTALVNFLRECRDRNYYDKIWVVTPTYHSNKEIWSICGLTEKDCREPAVTVLHEILKEMEDEKALWDDHCEQCLIYEKFKTDEEKQVEDIDAHVLVNYHERGLFNNLAPTRPKWKYPEEQPPRFAVVLDDCLNSPIMARPTAGLVNLAIRHRHVCGGLGTSLFFLVQSYSAQGGVPRPIRENTTHLLLFRIADVNQLKKIKVESDLCITNNEFADLLGICHAEPFQFLMIDFAPKLPDRQFRKGWNTYLIVDSLAGLKEGEVPQANLSEIRDEEEGIPTKTSIETSKE
mgnify:FL=1